MPIHDKKLPRVFSTDENALYYSTIRSETVAHQIAELLATNAVDILRPEPLNLNGLWNSRKVIGIA